MARLKKAFIEREFPWGFSGDGMLTMACRVSGPIGEAWRSEAGSRQAATGRHARRFVSLSAANGRSFNPALEVDHDLQHIEQ